MTAWFRRDKPPTPPVPLDLYEQDKQKLLAWQAEQERRLRVLEEEADVVGGRPDNDDPTTAA